MMIFRPGQRLVIPGVQVFQPRGTSAAASGILDGISNVAAAYSLRKLRTAYAGSAVRVRRSSDSTEQDIGFDGTGEFDSALFSSFVGGGTGFVKTWYDQSVNGYNATQTTTANQPEIVLSAANAKPALRFDGIDDSLQLASISLPQPISVITMLKQISHVGNARIIALGGTAIVYQTGSSGDIVLYAGLGGDTRLNFGTSAYNICSALFNGNSPASRIWKNGGTPDSGSPGTASGTALFIGANQSGTQNANIDVADLIILSAAIDTADHNTIGADMATRYGLSWTTVT